MSNPAVYVLGETEINGNKIRIEDNLGEAIHVHIGNFRISLSISEFNEIVNQFELATNTLLGLKGLSLNMFDKNALDWDWLHRYEKIEKIELVNVKIKDLLTKNESSVSSEIQEIVSVSKSRQYKALCHDCTELERYVERNNPGRSNLERLDSVLHCIKKNGYPYDNKYILVNQYNQIYDGDHRAACLLKLLGEETSIPVCKITFSGEKSIEEQCNLIEKSKDVFLEKEKVKIKDVKKWSEELNTLDYSYAEFINYLKQKEYDFFCIDTGWSHNGKVVADKIIVLEKNKVIDFCKQFGVSYFGKSEFRYYSFLYSMQRMVYISLSDIKILVSDCICCKSKFENAVMPLDKKIQGYCWNHIYNNSLDNIMQVLYVIVDSTINSNGFSEESIIFIKKNRDILDENNFINLLKTVFFGYADKLIDYLKNDKYEKAYDEYIINDKY